MCLELLHQNENAHEFLLQLSSYLLKIGDMKLEVDKKKSNQLPSAIRTFIDISTVVNCYSLVNFVSYNNNG